VLGEAHSPPNALMADSPFEPKRQKRTGTQSWSPERNASRLTGTGFLNPTLRLLVVSAVLRSKRRPVLPQTSKKCGTRFLARQGSSANCGSFLRAATVVAW